MERNNDSYEMIRQLAAAGESGAFEWLEERSRPFLELMCYYKCAMMEVETKFNVLNEEYAFAHDRNPISSIRHGSSASAASRKRCSARAYRKP